MNYDQKYLQAIRNYGSFFIVTTLFAIYLVLLEYGVMAGTGGVFSYPIDDVYIHMQVAKNLAAHGTWGITPGVFASACSSILYPLLLTALFKCVGPHILLPFLVNIAAAVGLIFVADQWLLKKGVPFLPRVIALLIAVILMPLPIMVCTGMEHTLQTLFDLLFLKEIIAYLDDGDLNTKSTASRYAKPVLCAMLVTGIRYEGVLLIAPAMLSCLFYKKPKMAFFLGLAGALPITVFGLYSLSKGSHFLPNSVLLKSAFATPVTDIKLFFRIRFNHFFIPPIDNFTGIISYLSLERMLFILPLMLLLAWITGYATRSLLIFIFMVLGATVLQMAASSTGWFFRYEAYLLFLGTLVSAFVLYRSGVLWFRKKRYGPIAVSGFVLIIALVPILTRSGEAFLKIRQSCINIFEQQCQSAAFIRRFYDHSAVAINDLGAVSYFTDAAIVDLWGLGDINVCNQMLTGEIDASWVDRYVRTKNVQLAITFKGVRNNFLPGWIKVADLEIRNNFSSADSVVQLSSPTPELASKLKTNLQMFQATAPAGIRFVY